MRGDPSRAAVVLAAAEYIAVPVNPVQMFDNAVRRRPRRDRARVLARYMTIEFVALPGTIV